MRDHITVGRGVLGLRRGCLPFLVLGGLALVVFMLTAATLWGEFESVGVRLLFGSLDVVLFVVIVWMARAFRPLQRRLVVIVSADELTFESHEPTVTLPRADVGMVELTADAMGYVIPRRPDGSPLGGWATRWYGLQAFRLIRALKKFGYPMRKTVLNRWTGTYIDSPWGRKS